MSSSHSPWHSALASSAESYSMRDPAPEHQSLAPLGATYVPSADAFGPFEYSSVSSIPSMAGDDGDSDIFVDARETLDSSTSPSRQNSIGSGEQIRRQIQLDDVPHRGSRHPHRNLQRHHAGRYQPALGSASSSLEPYAVDTAMNSPQASSVVSEGVSYSQKCGICQQSSRDVVFCNVCLTSFCDACWHKQFLHLQNRLGPNGIPHEKTLPLVAQMVSKALTPPSNEQVREQLHRDDEITSWFGIERSPDGTPIFQDYGRFTELMANTLPFNLMESHAFQVDAHQIARDNRTPSLISFVGDTGAGKSTLIKLLIDFNNDGTGRYDTPIIGAAGAHVPTSEDVHLYLDPCTASAFSPLLFADCEGLGGGEREPMGAALKKKRRKEQSSESVTGRISRAITERQLTWADGPRRGRQFAVTNLYPRLLYTFSDVIVFVLKNPRVVESVFDRLVEWAAAVIETSTNQPVLPHAVIVLNASENDINPDLWDVHANSASILDSLASTVNENTTFKRYAQFWRERGRRIDTLEQLLLSYYSSIQVLRVPAQGRPRLMEQQILKLYDGILTASIAARLFKSQVRMLLNVEDMESYLQYAFAHYSGTLDSPFDFVQASFSNSPIPPNFGGNIIKLAINIMDLWKDRIKPETIFTVLGLMVASCMMLDSTRSGRFGSAEQIFPKYIEHLDAALENFCNQHWPCEFTESKSGKRCVNVKSGHKNSHQLKNGKIFATGDYVSNFTFERFCGRFRYDVYYHLSTLLEEHERRTSAGEQREQAAANIHKDKVLSTFFQHVAVDSRGCADYGSHTACLCCLFHAAEHALPCGHILCTPCIQTFGHRKCATVLTIDECPIEGTEARPFQTWAIYTKPRFAGVRLLILDGGGMRGIVELEILRQLEHEIGVKIPVQCLFDLVVGTSTGGLIALGLACKNWSVEDCISHFENICETAFTRRAGSQLPVIGFFVDNYHHSRYETKAIEKALKITFGEEDYLFGGQKPTHIAPYPLKVAVTATSMEGRSAVIFTNYNRTCNDKLQYAFQRPERCQHELKLWEAARATSAAPRYFRQFEHEATQRAYVDGAVYHNNPIRVAEQERKLLWPDLEDAHPDIVLSLGTAFSAQLHQTESLKLRTHQQRGVLSHTAGLINLLKNHLATSIECGRIWDSFFAQLPREVRYSRFVRVDPELIGDVPELDEAKKLPELQTKVREWLKTADRIRILALQLIATTFYFETLSSPYKVGGQTYQAEGRIMCRFPRESKEIRELGKFFHRRLMQGERAYFAFMDEDKIAAPDQKIDMDPDQIDKMLQLGIFESSKCTIRISSRTSRTEILLSFSKNAIYPISGFPRSMFLDDRNPKASSPDVFSNSNRWAGGSLRSRSLRVRWKTPNLEDIRPVYNLQNYQGSIEDLGTLVNLEPAHKVEHTAQAPVTRPTNAPSGNSGGISTPIRVVASPARFLRSAFRSLLQPVRVRAKEATESDAGQPQQSEVFEIDDKENDVYNRWLSDLSSPANAGPDTVEHYRASYSYFYPEGYAELQGTSGPVELPGSLYWAQELDSSLSPSGES